MMFSHEFPDNAENITRSMPKLTYCFENKTPRNNVQGVVNLTIF